MKNIFLTIAAIVLLGSSFKPAGTANAVAQQMQGLYSLTDSHPAAEFETLGTITVVAGFGGVQYEDVRDCLIKKALKEHPTADGIILTLRSGKADKADCIKFK